MPGKLIRVTQCAVCPYRGYWYVEASDKAEPHCTLTKNPKLIWESQFPIWCPLEDAA